MIEIYKEEYQFDHLFQNIPLFLFLLWSKIRFQRHKLVYYLKHWSGQEHYFLFQLLSIVF